MTTIKIHKSALKEDLGTPDYVEVHKVGALDAITNARAAISSIMATAKLTSKEYEMLHQALHKLGG